MDQALDDLVHYLSPTVFKTSNGGSGAVADERDVVVNVNRDTSKSPAILYSKTDYDIHCAYGHRGEEQSAANNIPWVKDCRVCTGGNCTKAPVSKGVRKRETKFGKKINLDFKISSVPGTNHSTVLLGASDDATGFGWTHSLTDRTECEHYLRKIRADIRRKGGELEIIHTDNDSVITSKSFDRFLVEDPAHLMTLSLVPAYHHEFNPQEAKFRVQKEMATKAIYALGENFEDPTDAYKYYNKAYEYTTEVLNCLKYKRHGDKFFSPAPNEAVMGKNRKLKDMFAFGTRVFVNDPDRHPHNLAGKEGIVVGYSQVHSFYVHQVLMLKTRRIIKTMDARLSPIPEFEESAADSPLVEDMLNPIEFGESLDEDQAMPTEGTPKMITNFNIDIIDHFQAQSAVNPNFKYTKNNIQDFQDHVVRMGDQSAYSKGNYIDKRCRAICNVTVKDTNQVRVQDSKGVWEKYNAHKNLCYDLNSRRCILEIAPLPTSAELEELSIEPLDDDDKIIKDVQVKSKQLFGGSTSKNDPQVCSVFADDIYGRNDGWLNRIPKHKTMLSDLFKSDGSMTNSLFDSKAQLALSFLSSVAPIAKDQHDPWYHHAVEIEWNPGEIEIYDFTPDSAPHGFHASASTTTISPNDKPPSSIKQVMRLPDKPRQLYLTALNKEYMGLWDKGMFKLVKRSEANGKPILPTTTVFKMKFHADGSPDCAKARVCIRGDLMLPGRDFGATASPTAQCDSVKLVCSECPSQGKTCVTYDLSQAFTQAPADPLYPTFIKQFPATKKVVDADTGQELVMKLLFMLYGDPAAPMRFHLCLHSGYMDYKYVVPEYKEISKRTDMTEKQYNQLCGPHIGKKISWSQSQIDPCCILASCQIILV